MPKATLYGGRWKRAGGLGQGGQSVVFRAVDVTKQLEGEFALKLIRNATRIGRFANEVEAVKRLAHPNIITLVDHSALTDEDLSKSRFLVMPIADGGDLSDPERLTLYKGSIDAVLQVARQITDALIAAHLAEVIHRDIKPKNILFTGKGHSIWVSDFGICLIRDRARSTEENEVVGARAFMAPELEHGGRLDVTAAADVYSLGKLIFYMFCGGQIVPREGVFDAHYDPFFSGGELPQRLRFLLERMIAPPERRIQSMGEVAEQLRTLIEWERNARIPLASTESIAAFEQLRARSHNAVQVTTTNKEAREQERQDVERVKEGFQTWVRDELKLVASRFGSDEYIEVVAGEIGSAGHGLHILAKVENKAYVPVAAYELRLRMAAENFGHVHRLRISLCEGPKELVTTTAEVVGSPKRAPTLKPARDPQMAMIPAYFQTSSNGEPVLQGFLTKKDQIGVESAPTLAYVGRGQERVTFMAPATTNTFNQTLSQCVAFGASEWLSARGRLDAGLKEAVDTFVSFILSRV